MSALIDGRETLRRWAGLAPAATITTALFALPLVYFLVVSFWRVRAYRLQADFTLEHYRRLLAEYGDVLAYTLALALVVALIVSALAWGFAYFCRFRAGRLGLPLVFVALLTIFGGYLTKIYAWRIILGEGGILNSALMALGIVSEPITLLLFNPGAVVITLVHYLLPLAVLPIYGAMRGISDAALEAARDLGATPVQVARDIVLPQARAGLLIAFATCFFFAAGDYVAPTLVGGTSTSLIGTFIQSQFGHRLNIPMGAAMSFAVLGLTAAIVALAAVALGFATRVRR